MVFAALDALPVVAFNAMDPDDKDHLLVWGRNVARTDVTPPSDEVWFPGKRLGWKILGRLGSVLAASHRCHRRT